MEVNNFHISINFFFVLDKTIENYLQAFHRNDIIAILKADDVTQLPFFAVEVNLRLLQKKCTVLYEQLSSNVWTEKLSWTRELQKIQQTLGSSSSSFGTPLTVKHCFPVMFHNLPEEIIYDMPSVMKINRLIEIEGTIIKTKAVGLQEVLRKYKCRECGEILVIIADRFRHFHFPTPQKCPILSCASKVELVEHVNVSDSNYYEHFMKYQEVTIILNNNDQLTVELDAELCGSCNVTDHVTITGMLEQRYKPDEVDNVKLVVRAAGVHVNDNLYADIDELLLKAQLKWKQALSCFHNNELSVRDELVCCVAPELIGMSLAKLGLLLVLCSGEDITNEEEEKGIHLRSIAHVLFVGDPGVGKSHLLKAASDLSIKSVSAVGYSTTSAGLIARHYVEDGNVHIEPGALLRANNGVCCIDEINCMSTDHCSSIHEVMESQQITISKGMIAVLTHAVLSNLK